MKDTVAGNDDEFIHALSTPPPPPPPPRPVVVETGLRQRREDGLSSVPMDSPAIEEEEETRSRLL